MRAGGAVVATVTVDGCVPGLFLLDVAARVRLAAGRLGWTVRVLDEEVCELAAFAGLDPLGQPERREQPRVEEVVQADEPPA